MPSIEVRLSENFCLIDFMDRLCPHFPKEPYLLEQKKYSRKLAVLIKSWKRQRKDKTYHKNLSRFKSPVFKSLWEQHKKEFKQQEIKIKGILDKEGKSYLKEVSRVAKIENFPYKKYIVYLIFPKLVGLKPEKYGPTGTSAGRKSSCLLTVGIPFNLDIKDGKDLYVLWHEMIHSLAPLRNEAMLAWEAIVQTYEEILSKRPKKYIALRITRFFQNENLSPKHAKELGVSCMLFDWETQDMFDFWNFLVNKLISMRCKKKRISDIKKRR